MVDLEIMCLDPKHSYKRVDADIFQGDSLLYPVFHKDPFFSNGNDSPLGLFERRQEGYYFVPCEFVPHKVVEVKVNSRPVNHDGPVKSARQVRPKQVVQIYVEPQEYSSGYEKKKGKALWAELRLVNV